MSTSWRATALPAAIARAAFSRRHSCHGPRKKSDLPPSSSSTAVATASRNQRSWATRITAASSDVSVSSSHSRLRTSRWFVGSSSSRRSGSPASARPERGAGQLTAGERVQLAVEVLVAESRARGGPRPPARASPSRRRARAGLAPRRIGAASRARGLRRPSPSRASAGRLRARSSPKRRTARTHAASTLAAAAGAGRGARCACPSRRRPPRRSRSSRPTSMRSSVVFPAPFGPESATTSPRSTLNETPSNSGAPECSLRRLEAMTTAMARHRVESGS